MTRQWFYVLTRQWGGYPGRLDVATMQGVYNDVPGEDRALAYKVLCDEMAGRHPGSNDGATLFFYLAPLSEPSVTQGG